MTRTTDDLQDAEPWRPLGHPEPKAPPPAPPAPTPQGPYGVVADKDGHLRTTKTPKETP